MREDLCEILIFKGEKIMSNVLNDFLKSAKAGFTSDEETTVVIGNEAADLDSMASAVTYAYFLKNTGNAKNVVPLINIPLADFKLRTEAVFLFKEAGVDAGNLISVTDIDLDSLYSKGNMRLVLTDHNKIGAHQETFKDAVVAILDHHADDGEYPRNAETDIRPVGSACTLVAEKYLSEAPGSIDTSIGTLLLGTILLDTVNLDPDAGRVKDEDKKAAAALIEKTGLDGKKLFDTLQFEKFNVSSLGSYDLLRKDYKEWDLNGTMCGIGSVLMSVTDWLKKDRDVIDSFEKFLKERKLDVLLAMNAFTQPEFTRNLVVYVPDQALRSRLIEFLEGAGLELEKIDGGDISKKEALDIYNQKNLGISRKKLQPLLKEFFSK